jgi:hypothetical protein
MNNGARCANLSDAMMDSASGGNVLPNVGPTPGGRLRGPDTRTTLNLARYRVSFNDR